MDETYHKITLNYIIFDYRNEETDWEGKDKGRDNMADTMLIGGVGQINTGLIERLGHNTRNNSIYIYIYSYFI